jgi:hypothetical protein
VSLALLSVSLASDAPSSRRELDHTICSQMMLAQLTVKFFINDSEHAIVEEVI